MTITATILREKVLENRFTLGRLSKDTLGEDYKELTDLYRAALDALTIWASKDYSHTSTQEDVDRMFDEWESHNYGYYFFGDTFFGQVTNSIYNFFTGKDNVDSCKDVYFGQTPETGLRKFVLDVLNFFGNLFA
jgi:hypothetical protein